MMPTDTRAELGLGCARFGRWPKQGQTEEDSMAAMDAAVDVGVTHFDTALMYGKGRSEKMVGKFVRERHNRDAVFIASKVMADEAFSVESIQQGLQQSLDNLGLDRVNLYYAHWPREGVDMRPGFEALRRLREQGVVGAIGVSNFSVEQIEEVRTVAPIEYCQVGYNMLWRKVERDVVPHCHAQGIKVVTYGALAMGVFTGKYGPDLAQHKGELPQGTIWFHERFWPVVYEAIEELKRIAAESERSTTQLALHWLASRPGVSIVLAGARNAQQVRDTADVFNAPMDPTLLERLNDWSDAITARLPDVPNMFSTPK